MNNLFETTDNMSNTLTYRFNSFNEIDDIILQLLNESEIKGFVGSRINRKQKTIEYDVSGLVTVNSHKEIDSTKEKFISLLKNFNELVVFLNDSFIEIEYVVLDEDAVYFDPATGRLFLIVLPCEAAFDSAETIDGLIRKLKGHFVFNEKDDSEIQAVMAKWPEGTVGLDKLGSFIVDLEASGAAVNISEDRPSEETVIFTMPEKTDSPEPDIEAEMLKELEKEFAEETRPEEAVDIEEEKEFVQEIIEAHEHDSDMAKEPEEPVIEEPVVYAEEEIPAGAETENIPDELQTEEEVIETDPEENPVEEEQEAETEISEPSEEETSEEQSVDESVPEEAEEQIPETVLTEEATPVKEDELKTIAQIREELRDEIELQLRTEYEMRYGADKEQQPAYLIRKSTGEVIQLTKETFVIGTKPLYCDYVITNNAYISNIHAIIRYNSEHRKYYIIDCNSKNGIHIGAVRMLKNQAAELKDQTMIFIATELFIFQC